MMTTSNADIDNTFRYGFNARSRTIRLWSSINEEAVERASAALQVLDSEAGTITVSIFSGGGCVHSGLALYDAIRECENRVITVGYGSVMSVATTILQAGDERLLKPNAVVMVHETSGNMGWTRYSDAEIDVAEWKRLQAQQAAIVARRAGITLAQFLKWYEKDRFFTADEAVRAGFADRVVETKPVKRRRR